MLGGISDGPSARMHRAMLTSVSVTHKAWFGTSLLTMLSLMTNRVWLLENRHSQRLAAALEVSMREAHSLGKWFSFLHGSWAVTTHRLTHVAEHEGPRAEGNKPGNQPYTGHSGFENIQEVRAVLKHRMGHSGTKVVLRG